MANVKILLAGDIVPTRPMGRVSAMARPVFDLVESADLAIGNLEIALTRRGEAVDKMIVRRADPDSAQGNPFHILSVANNHTMDFGWAGLQDAIACLSAAGATVIGGGADRPAAWHPDIRIVGGVTIGTLALSCLAPGDIAATPTGPGIAAIRVDTRYSIDERRMAEEPGDPAAITIHTNVRAADLARATAAVTALKAQCDYVVVTLHWGFGSGETLAEYQLPLGQALIEAGADIVHGHHSHAVQGIGAYRGKPILFSQGTFMAQQFFLPADEITRKVRAGMSPDGYVAMLEIADRSAAPRITIYPTVLDEDRQPIFADKRNFDRIAGNLVRLSAPYGVDLKSGDTPSSLILDCAQRSGA